MSIFQKILSFFKKKTRKINLSPSKKILRPLGFQKELEELQKKLDRFLLTKKVTQGPVVERKNYFLTKTGTYLYKLEGTDKSGQEFSIILSTGNFLSKKDGKITGFLQVSEAELNRIIQKEYGQLESLLSGFTDLNLDENSLSVLGVNETKFNWKEILFWDTIWKEQILRKLRPNHLALLLVSLDSSFQKFFLENATPKQKKIISDELFYLNQGVNNIESNPNTRNFDLTSIDLAFKEFKKIISLIKRKKELET
jgi:hypothetical protein